MMTPEPTISGPVRVSILERLLPAFAFTVAAISGAVGALMIFRFFALLRQAENAGYEAFFIGMTEIEFVVAGVLVFALALCAIGLVISAVRLFTTNTTASPPGILFLIMGGLSLVPAFAIHYALHMMKNVVTSSTPTEGGISSIADTVTTIGYVAIGAACLIALINLAFALIPFSSRPGRKWSPLVCLLLVEICIAGMVGIYFWEARTSLAERDQQRVEQDQADRAARETAVEDEDANGTSTKDENIDDFVSDTNSKGLPKTISGGVLNGKAIDFPQPAYPAAARAVRASGTVTVQITVDETGKVTSATAVAGHPLLRPAAVSAARQARFTPTKLAGKAVKISGVVTYRFEEQ